MYAEPIAEDLSCRRSLRGAAPTGLEFGNPDQPGLRGRSDPLPFAVMCDPFRVPAGGAPSARVLNKWWSNVTSARTFSASRDRPIPTLRYAGMGTIAVNRMLDGSPFAAIPPGLAANTLHSDMGSPTAPSIHLGHRPRQEMLRVAPDRPDRWASDRGSGSSPEPFRPSPTPKPGCRARDLRSRGSPPRGMPRPRVPPPKS